jgi:ribosome-binding factor A
LRLRVAPEIAFKLDESVERAARIETLLAQVREKKSDDDGSR